MGPTSRQWGMVKTHNDYETGHCIIYFYPLHAPQCETAQHKCTTQVPTTKPPHSGFGWRGSLVVGRRTCDLRVAGSRPSRDAAAQQP